MENLTEELNPEYSEKQLQESARTSVKAVLPLHEKLRKTFQWYRNWHLNPCANRIHIELLFLYIAVIILGATLGFNGKLTTKTATTIHAATTDCTWTNIGGDHLWSNPANWNCGIPDVVPNNSGYAVILDGAVSTSNLTIDIPVTIGSFTVKGTNLPNPGNVAYGGTITSNANLATSKSSEGSGDFILRSGTYIANGTTIEIAGNWNHANATFTANTSTVHITGTNSTITPGTGSFNHLIVADSSKTTTLVMNITANTLALGSGTLSSDWRFIFISDSGEPFSNGGGIVTNTYFRFTASNITIPGGNNYYQIYYTPSSSAGNDTAILSLGGDVTTGSVRVYSGTAYARATLDLAGYDLTIRESLIMGGATNQLAKVTNSASDSNLSIGSTLTINNDEDGTSGSSFEPDNVFEANNIDLTFTASSAVTVFDNNGDATSFQAGDSNITFSPLGDGRYRNPIFAVGANGTTFNNLTINHDTTSATDKVIISENALNISGDLTISDGILGLDTNNTSVNTAGNVTVAAAGAITKGTGTWTFNGGKVQNLQANSQDLGNVTLTGAGTEVVQTGSTNALGAVTAGIMTLNENTIWDASDKGFTIATLSNSNTFQLQGGNPNSSITNGNDIDSGVVEYTATTGTRDIKSWQYYDLRINGLGGIFTLPNDDLINPIVVNRHLDIAAGTLRAGARDLTVKGNWANTGTFTPDTGTISLSGDGEQTVSGSNTYYDLAATTSSARTVKFAGGSTQTVSHIFTATGVAGQLLTLTSANIPTKWTIVPDGANVSYTDINYSINSGSSICATHSTSTQGNNEIWNLTSGSECVYVPNLPANLSQVRADDSQISIGGWTKTSSIKFQATASSYGPAGSLALCVEYKNLATSFDESETCGDFVAGTEVEVAATINDLTEGQYHFRARVKNLTGVYSNWANFGDNAEGVRDFGMDSDNPENLAVSINPSTWTNTNPQITFSASDAASGVSFYEYKIDSESYGSHITSPYILNISSLTDGEHTLYIRATDFAGNATEQSAIFRTDRSSPSNVTEIKAANNGSSVKLSWKNPAADFSKVIVRRSTENYPLSQTEGSAAYEGSGTSFDETSFEFEKWYYYTVFSLDQAGNVSSGGIISFKVEASSTATTPSSATQGTSSGATQSPASTSFRTISSIIISKTDPKLESAVKPAENLDIKTVSIQLKSNETYLALSQTSTYHFYPNQELKISIPANAFPRPVKALILNFGPSSYLLGLKDDRFEATIMSPGTQGQSSLDFSIVYQDESLETIKVDSMVDPYGFVYQKKRSLWQMIFKRSQYTQVRLVDATVTLYVFNQADKKWKVWKDEKTGQKNPHRSNQSGEFSFTVPKGYYYLEAKKSGFERQKSDMLKVENEVLSVNVEMTPVISSLEKFLLAVFLIILTANIAPLISKLRKKRISSSADLDDDLDTKDKEDPKTL